MSMRIFPERCHSKGKAHPGWEWHNIMGWGHSLSKNVKNRRRKLAAEECPRPSLPGSGHNVTRHFHPMLPCQHRLCPCSKRWSLKSHSLIKFLLAKFFLPFRITSKGAANKHLSTGTGYFCISILYKVNWFLTFQPTKASWASPLKDGGGVRRKCINNGAFGFSVNHILIFVLR